MANEFFRYFGPDVAITITPGLNGILQVIVDGEAIFDRKAEGGIYPDLPRVKKMKDIIAEKVARLQPAPAGD